MGEGVWQWPSKCKQSDSQYKVSSAWARKLWLEYALADNVFSEYIYLRKNKPAANRRNVDLVRHWKRERELAERVQERSKRIKANPSFY